MSITNETLVTTLFDQSEQIADVVLNGHFLLNKLKKLGRIKERSGYEFRKPALVESTGQGAWFTGLEGINLAEIDDADYFVFKPKKAYDAVLISGDDIRANKGAETQLIDLAEMKIEAMTTRLRNRVAKAVRGDGTGSSGKELEGIRKAVSTSPTSGTYGGKTRSSTSYAQNVAISVSGGITVTTVQDAIVQAKLRVSREGDQPDIAAATENAWRALHNSLTAIQRITGGGEKGSAGYSSLEFAGIEFVLDGGYGYSTAEDDTQIRILTSKYWSLDVYPDAYFKPIGGKDPRPLIDQDGVFAVMLFQGALGCAAPTLQVALS